MKRNYLILTVLIAASVCFLQVGWKKQQVVAAEESKPELAAPGPAGSSVESETAAASVKRGPEITFEKLVHDFGNIEPQSRSVCEFKFTNTGDSLLKIIDISKSCGCTPYTLEKKEYEPNETGTLKVEYHAGSQPAAVHKTLYVSSNDEARPRVELVISGEIVYKVDCQPKKLDLAPNKENAGCW